MARRIQEMARNLKESYEILIEKYRNVTIPKESNRIQRIV
jgi:hypothetical protein